MIDFLFSKKITSPACIRKEINQEIAYTGTGKIEKMWKRINSRIRRAVMDIGGDIGKHFR